MMKSADLPTEAAVAALGETYRLDISDEERQAITEAVAGIVSAFNDVSRFAHLADGLVEKPAARRSWRPVAGDNALGGWYVRSDIREREDGPLAGKTIAIKDSVAVAGIPMANGSAVMEGFVPEFDATVVSRILSAGGTIAGKAVCEPMCLASIGAFSHTGPVRNPYDPAFGSGGSSSGSAALVSSRAVDMAIGGDNGGSIRVPASWCGIYGIKPTWGLVPYTGAMSISAHIDHLGPMAATMADLELLLEAIAGPDDLDPRQAPDLMLGRPGFSTLAELRVGVLDEGFGFPGVSEPAVDVAVSEAAQLLRDKGAKVSRVSIPLHSEPAAIIATGLDIGHQMFEMDGLAAPLIGYSNPAMTERFHRAWRDQASRLDLPSKTQLIASAFVLGQEIQPQLALARNLALALRRSYDAALREVDLLLMPTVTHRARRLPDGPVPPAEHLALAWGQSYNTRPFNSTGHPALTVPCAVIDGLPVGMMLVGRRGDDATVMRAGRIFADEIYTPPLPV